MTTSLQGGSAFLETHNFLDETGLICGIRCSFTATASGIRLPTGKTSVQATLDPAELNRDLAIDHALLAAVKDCLGTTRRGRATQLVSRIQASKRRWLEQWMPGLTYITCCPALCLRTASSGICCTQSMWPGPAVSTTPGRETVVGAQHPGVPKGALAGHERESAIVGAPGTSLPGLCSHVSTVRKT